MLRSSKSNGALCTALVLVVLHPVGSASSDTVVQRAYLKASNTDAGDQLGVAVGASGDTVVIGAEDEDSNATGVNGDETDNSSGIAGAAYVFVRNGGSWSQEAYLKASNTGTFDRFGESVAISGDTIVVGASLEDSGATGVNGNQADDGTGNAGAAYVFLRTGTTWSQQAYLKAPAVDASDNFGGSVAISGDTIVVGAAWEDGGETGVNGDPTDNSVQNAGAAYVFVRTGTTWSQQAYLKASTIDVNDFFGLSVAVSGDTVVIGARHEDSGATGVNGDQLDDGAADAGAAYVFVRNGTTWTQEAYLKASNAEAGDFFGIAVAASENTIAVGASSEDSSAAGVNGGEGNGSLNSGAVYLFVRGASGWSQQAYLKASHNGGGDLFGDALAIHEDSLVVGATSEDSDATGVDGDPFNNLLARSGAAYLFRRGGSTWSQRAYLKASNTGSNDRFGESVAVSEDVVVVGAYLEDSNATGVDGNQSDDNAQAAGAAYAFDLPPYASCTVRNGSDVNPIDFVCRTDPVLGSNWRATIQVAPSVGSATFATVIQFGSGPTSGFIHPVSGEPLIFPPFTFNISLARHRVSLPSDPSLAGTTLYAQGIRLEVAPETVVLLNALDLTLGY